VLQEGPDGVEREGVASRGGLGGDLGGAGVGRFNSPLQVLIGGFGVAADFDGEGGLLGLVRGALSAGVLEAEVGSEVGVLLSGDEGGLSVAIKVSS
jgi:hypothetical protein